MLRQNADPLSQSFDDVLYEMLQRYDGRPLSVNFRKVVGANSGIDRFTHLIHPYPAKLLPNIPLFFLNCSQLGEADDVLYDPFCGSGTVLLEGVLGNRRVIGCDTNPLARLISSVKTTLYPEGALEDGIDAVLRAIPQRGRGLPCAPIDLESWFSPQVLRQLDRLASAVRDLPTSSIRQFMEVCFSATVSKTSLADPTVSVPVRLNPNKKSLSSEQRAARRRWVAERQSANVIEIFRRIAEVNVRRLSRLSRHVHERFSATSSRVLIGDDARAPLDRERVDLIVTSPPYGSAQKYVRASGLSLQMLGLAPEGLRPIERRTIGREHYGRDDIAKELPIVAPSSEIALERIGRRNPLRRHIAASFLVEMRDALSCTVRHLRRRGHLVMVIGNNRACGHIFDSRLYLTEICEKLGLDLVLELRDRIRSRGLMTKRNETAGIIVREAILVFRKR